MAASEPRERTVRMKSPVAALVLVPQSKCLYFPGAAAAAASASGEAEAEAEAATVHTSALIAPRMIDLYFIPSDVLKRTPEIQE